MTIAAFVMTYAYTFDCMFFIGSSPDMARPQGYGLWYIQSVLATGTTSTLGTTISYMPQGCETFRQYGQPASELMDTPFRFARVMSMIAVLLSLCAMISTLLPMCLQFDHKSYFMASGALGIILGIFSGLCFVRIWNSDTCSWTEAICADVAHTVVVEFVTGRLSIQIL